MGKRKNTLFQIQAKQNKPIEKDVKSKKKILSFSTSKILGMPQYREIKIAKSIKLALKNLCERSLEETKRKLMSVLDIHSQKQVVCSAMNIPSITSIQSISISKHELCSFHNHAHTHECSDSNISVIESLSYRILENEPELMLTYICLVEKAMNKLGICLSRKQNQKLIRGIWNILIKFWSDEWYQYQYTDINAKIQWGILELLNFDFEVSKKERMLMAVKIHSLSQINE